MRPAAAALTLLGGAREGTAAAGRRIGLGLQRQPQGDGALLLIPVLRGAGWVWVWGVNKCVGGLDLGIQRQPQGDGAFLLIPVLRGAGWVWVWGNVNTMCGRCGRLPTDTHSEMHTLASEVPQVAHTPTCPLSPLTYPPSPSSPSPPRRHLPRRPGRWPPHRPAGTVPPHRAQGATQRGGLHHHTGEWVFVWGGGRCVFWGGGHSTGASQVKAPPHLPFTHIIIY